MPVASSINSSSTIVASLCRLTAGICNQKLELMKVLVSKFGNEEKAQEYYRKICPLAQASIGQHIRHSMDHIELATSLLVVSPSQQQQQQQQQVHYDIRVRGSSDESDINVAKRRIETVIHRLERHPRQPQQNMLFESPVDAYFMLSGDAKTEYPLPSTIGRELGFAAHHAIHHMAMIKIIATGTSIALTEEELPFGFGKAPSTIQYDQSNKHS